MCCGSHAADNSSHDLLSTRLSAGMQGSRREQSNTLSVPGTSTKTWSVTKELCGPEEPLLTEDASPLVTILSGPSVRCQGTPASPASVVCSIAHTTPGKDSRGPGSSPRSLQARRRENCGWCEAHHRSAGLRACITMPIRRPPDGESRRSKMSVTGKGRLTA